MSGSLARAAIALAAATLPVSMRERYREQWLADLEGAAELDLSRAAVARGALFFASSAGFEARFATPEAARRVRLIVLVVGIVVAGAALLLFPPLLVPALLILMAVVAWRVRANRALALACLASFVFLLSLMALYLLFILTLPNPAPAVESWSWVLTGLTAVTFVAAAIMFARVWGFARGGGVGPAVVIAASGLTMLAIVVGFVSFGVGIGLADDGKDTSANTVATLGAMVTFLLAGPTALVSLFVTLTRSPSPSPSPSATSGVAATISR